MEPDGGNGNGNGNGEDGGDEEAEQQQQRQQHHQQQRQQQEEERREEEEQACSSSSDIVEIVDDGESDSDSGGGGAVSEIIASSAGVRAVSAPPPRTPLVSSPLPVPAPGGAAWPPAHDPVLAHEPPALGHSQRLHTPAAPAAPVALVTPHHGHSRRARATAGGVSNAGGVAAVSPTPPPTPTPTPTPQPLPPPPPHGRPPGDTSSCTADSRPARTGHNGQPVHRHEPVKPRERKEKEREPGKEKGGGCAPAKPPRAAKADAEPAAAAAAAAAVVPADSGARSPVGAHFSRKGHQTARTTPPTESHHRSPPSSSASTSPVSSTPLLGQADAASAAGSSPPRVRGSPPFGRLWSRMSRGTKENGGPAAAAAAAAGPSAGGGGVGSILRRLVSSDDGGARDPREAARERSEGARALYPGVVEARVFEELPARMQSDVRAARIATEDAVRHFDVLLNCLYFTTKARFAVLEERKAREREERENDRKRAVRVCREMRRQRSHAMPSTNSLEGVVDAGDPRTLFKKGEMIGRGGFGRVYRAWERPPPGQRRTLAASASAALKKRRVELALKVMVFRTEAEMLQIVSEIAFLRFCRHESILKFHSCFAVVNEIWLLTEFLEGGVLTDARRVYKFQEPHIAFIARALLHGIAYLHSEFLIHRDIKSANVMLSVKGDIKLIDFGLCCDASAAPPKITMVGSPAWMPPEMVCRRRHSFAVDVWSLGICIVELVNGRPPNIDSALRAMFLTGTRGHPQPLERPSRWSEALRAFVAACLTHDSDARPTAQDLLSHELLDRCADVAHMKKVLYGIFVMQNVMPL